MKKFKIGNKVQHLKEKTIHTIESIEIIDGSYYIFTEDSKCFPSSEIESHIGFHYDMDTIFKFLESGSLTQNEKISLERTFDKLKITPLVWKPMTEKEFLDLFHKS